MYIYIFIYLFIYLGVDMGIDVDIARNTWVYATTVKLSSNRPS